MKFTKYLLKFTEVRFGFASFLSGGFITAIVVNPPERKLAKRTSVKFGENMPNTIFWCFMTNCLNLKFSKYFHNIRKPESFCKFLLIVKER